jgi:NAD+ kinase
MTDVVIIAHHERGEAAELASTAVDWLASAGHNAWIVAEDAKALGLADLGADTDPATADVAISLGGDGTMLRTVQVVDGVPIIGVNVGLLGYLSEVEPPALIPALEQFFAGRYRIEERMILEAVVDRRVGDGADGQTRFTGLNEAVIEKQESGHTIRMLVSISGSTFTSYAADGLIVATPTGSTAYSLSARGPIVSPQHRALLLTPVSPHMLFDRALVLDPDEEVGIEVLGHRPADLSIDGRRVTTLAEGDTVTCRPAPEVARFVRFGTRHFHQILKAKFGLSDR